MKQTIFFITLGVFVSCICFFFWFDSDTQEINKQLDDLCTRLATTQQEKPVEALQNAAYIGALFTDHIRIELQEYNRTLEIDKKETVQRIIMFRKQSPGLEVELRDRSIDNIGDGNARVVGAVYIKGVSANEIVRDAQEAEITMQKVNGTWLISEIVLIAVMER